MPSYDAERWNAVSPYLDEVFEIPEAERSDWVAAVREQNSSVAEELEALLAAHSALVAEGFLEHAPAAPMQNRVGTSVSHYRILQLLGGGGMGVVYAAEDFKLGRRDGPTLTRKLVVRTFRFA